MAYPEPTEVAPWYLRNITQALALDETSGNVYVRTGFTGNIVIEGNVNIPGNIDAHVIELGNIDISGNTMPVSGNINIDAGNVTVLQGTDPWTVDGTVNIGTMPEVEIKNDTGNPIPVSKDTNTNSVTNPIYVEGVNNASFFAPTQSDAFGRLRVSNPLTLFDTQNRYYDQGQFVTKTTGTASSTYNANSTTFLLSASGAGASITRETTKSFIYQPGKSLFVLNTFAMNTPTSGITQRVGYYNDNNGIFFEVSGTTLNMVIRSYSSGSIVEDRIPQSSWNGDPLNGTGLSGITLNPALTQIFWTDVEWLGVGSVRVGFVINGQYIVCHTFNHANIAGNTTTYMGTAILPVRYELSTTGTAATMRQICSTVISEGGYTLSGLPGGIGHTLGSPIVLPNDDSFKPLISIRLKSTNPDAIVLPKNFTIVPVDQAIVKYRVYLQAVTSGGTWTSYGSNSSVEYNLAPTSISSGAVNSSGFLISNNQSINTPQDQGFGFIEQLSRDPFTPTMYEYVVEAATTGTNISVYASINWQEVS